MSTPRRGRRLALDVGTVRIGVAVSDPDGILAIPVETVARVADTEALDSADLVRIRAIADEYEAVEVVVGLPKTLRGEVGRSGQSVEAFGTRLTAVLDVPIVWSDERFSTVTATAALRASGVRGRGRRKVVDQAAAVEILQDYLDRMRRTRETESDRGALDG